MENENIVLAVVAIAVGGVVVYEMAKSISEPKQTKTTTSTNTTTQLSKPTGSYSNPFNYSQGWQGAGWYSLSDLNFTKLKSMPASGIVTNPFFTSNEAFYNNISDSLTFGSTVTSKISEGSCYIEVSPSIINRTPNTGQVITINGYNFNPGEKGYIAVNGDLDLTNFVANSNGTFSYEIQNTMSNTSISALWAAIQNIKGTTSYIVAYGYGGSGYSNKVSITIY